MSEEKRKVLEMLEQGKINVEEAHKLLEALGESGAPQEGPCLLYTSPSPRDTR